MPDREWAQDGGTGPSQGPSSGQPWPGVDPMVTETVVEQVVQALARGASVAAVARTYGLDRKTVRAWRTRGGYQPRDRRRAVSRLDPYRDWLAGRAPEVGYNAVVLHRELREQGFTGSVIIVRRAVVPLRAAAAPSVATVRFETAPGEQAQVDFGQVRVWIGAVRVAGLPGGLAVLHQALRLLCGPARSRLDHPGCGPGDAPQLDHQSAGDAVHARAAAARGSARAARHRDRRDLHPEGAHLPDRGERPGAAAADLAAPIARRRAWASSSRGWVPGRAAGSSWR